jgi:hypothetical protein
MVGLLHILLQCNIFVIFISKFSILYNYSNFIYYPLITLLTSLFIPITTPHYSLHSLFTSNFTNNSLSLQIIPIPLYRFFNPSASNILDHSPTAFLLYLYLPKSVGYHPLCWVHKQSEHFQFFHRMPQDTLNTPRLFNVFRSPYAVL